MIQSVTPIPHIYTNWNTYKSNGLLYLDFKDFNHGICYAMKLAVVKSYPDMELLTPILPYTQC